MRRSLTTLIALCCLCVSRPCNAQGTKLIDLLPGLYGGDGILLATAAVASHTAHFSIQSAANINRLNEQIASEVGVFPFSSSVGGFSFSFDPALGDFVSTTRSLGPLIAELPTTTGKGHFNFNVSYTYLTYSEFSGQSLSAFKVTPGLHQPTAVGFPDVRDQFENDTVEIEMDLGIRTQIVALSATYGLFDRLDVGVLLPFAFVDMNVKSEARVVESPENTLFPDIHTFVGGPEPATDEVSGNSSGLSDFVVRAKYNLYKGERTSLAVAALGQFGIADQEEFIGTGDSAVRPFLALARSYGQVTPHANVGYEFNLDRSERSALEYTLGFDVGSNKWTLAGEVLGSHELDGDGIGDDIVDTAWGIKWNPSGRWLLALNTRLSLNDAGLRSTFVSTLSLEYGF